MTAADVFRSAFDREPAGVWSAPGRVNLIGEHTDYNGGYVLPFAIDRRTYVAAARRDDGIVTARSLQRAGEVAQASLADLSPGREHGWPSYAFGMVWALLETGYDIGGVDIVLDGGVPSGSGLSSSAALECSVGLAVLDLHGIDLPLPELARVAQLAENNFVGVPCGLMDQMAVSVCQADHALFFDTRDDVRAQEPFAPHDAGLAVLVINTRAQHAHAGGEYAERRRSCETAAQQLGVPFLRDITASQLDDALRELDDEVLRKRTRHVVTENDRVLSTVALMRQGDVAQIGPMLTQSHRSLRDDFEVSCAELDLAVDTALAAGALGARMTGGGFGGSAIALVPDV
ncbi:MAG: galactokinase, partial [Acidothermaceae bacterium]